GFGLVIVEAMAAGLPVVSTAVDGPAEIITHEQNGILVPPGDAAALADAIRSLLDSPDRARVMAEAGRKRAQDFSIERMVHEYQKIYQRLGAC
ncbi:MAG: glycosyltransferase family 4 protein, partial [Hyphomicrobiales bacterium]|nr:glycosyltransferase family 4 protein [Hyphomicrobiales bacterium]